VHPRAEKTVTTRSHHAMFFVLNPTLTHRKRLAAFEERWRPHFRLISAGESQAMTTGNIRPGAKASAGQGVARDVRLCGLEADARRSQFHSCLRIDLEHALAACIRDRIARRAVAR